PDHAPDGKHLVFGWKNTWCLDRYSYGGYYPSASCQNWDSESGFEIVSSAGVVLRTEKFESGDGQLVAFSADSKSVWFAGADSTIKRLEIASRSVVQTLRGHASKVAAIALSRDRSLLLSASREGELKLFDVKTGDVLSTQVIEANMKAIGISPDGKR